MMSPLPAFIFQSKLQASPFSFRPAELGPGLPGLQIHSHPIYNARSRCLVSSQKTTPVVCLIPPLRDECGEPVSGTDLFQTFGPHVRCWLNFLQPFGYVFSQASRIRQYQFSLG